MSAARAPWDVVVAGLGPVGSMLTALLGRRGLRVIAVEPDYYVYPLPRAAHIDHTALRTVQEAGILDELLPLMIRNRGVELITADRRLLARLPGDQATLSGHPASMFFHQPTFERALRRAAASQPTVEFVLGRRVVEFEEEGELVRVRTAGEEGERDLRASFLVGCDGASSTVRKLTGAAMDELGFEESWLVIDLLLRREAPELPRNTTWVCDPARPHMGVPMPGPRYRFEFMLLPGESAEEIQQPAKIRQLLALWIEPEAVEVERTAVYRFRGLVARPWRTGRVLLAGDAAHMMPPFLGQGMCSGFRDVANLAWKLDHVIRRDAPLELLDTYEAERKPHIIHVTETSIRYGRTVCMLDREEAGERDRRMLSDSRPPEQRLPFQLGELQPGPLILAGGGEFFLQIVADGARSDDLVGQRFLVLARSPASLDGSAQFWQERVGALVATLADLDDAQGTLRRWMDQRGVDVVVVRPDRYVLGAGRSLEEITAQAGPLLVSDRVEEARAARGFRRQKVT